MSGLLRVREELHNRLLLARSLELLLLKPQFEELWESSNEEQKKEAEKHIKANNKDALVEWMRKHPAIDLGEKTVRQLIPMARRLGVKNYSRLSRDELIVAIKEKSDGSQ